MLDRTDRRYAHEAYGYASAFVQPEPAVAIPGHLDLHRPGRSGQHRLRPGPVAHVAGLPPLRGAVLLMTQVLGHLLIERGLKHRFGQLLEQAIRSGQRQALFLGQPNQLDRSLLLG